MSGPFRLPTGGLIDRTRTVRFRFDGLHYEGHPGDTLASALLANGVTLLGRSFKYHRPRGVFTAGPEEPSALVELGRDGRREPNLRATTVELHDGLDAQSQHRWPSLRHDIGAINQRLSRFLPAGFYYKTFKWPSAFWERVYEPIIRRAAGLGTAASEPDPDHYEHRHAHCDVLIVGGGPAGLAAALAAGRAGARVLLLEQDAVLGASLVGGVEASAWRTAVSAELGRLAETRLLARTTAVALYDHNVVGAVERVADHLPEVPSTGVRQRFWTIRAREIVLATGAIERLIAFPDNDRPGVMLSSAGRILAARYGVAVGTSPVLFTNNDEAYDAAFALHHAGVGMRAIIDVRASSAAADRAEALGIEVRRGAEVIGVGGRLRVASVDVRKRNGGGTARIAADALLISGGFTPNVQLASMTRAKLAWSAGIAAYVPGPPNQRERSAGAARGCFGIAAAAADGEAAGRAAAEAAGFAGAGSGPRLELPAGDVTPIEPFWEVPEHGKAFVDLQHDVKADDIRLAHQEGYSHIEHAKRYTTHAMATDQGKTGGLVGAAVLAAARGIAVEAVGLPTMRPYTSPVTWGAFAGREVGKHFHPIRRTPLDDWNRRNGAVFMDAGLWARAAYYPKPGEGVWDAILREARSVRTAVGICDVSTLGKIDLQGRDAATFLDRLYTNTFSTLPVGRARYGLMLREDGIVFDDGTTSRLAPDRFLVTTTTAKAAEVLEHMEHYAQVVWPELDVQMCSVTDQWGQMSIAGPRARDVLAAAVEGLKLGNDELPFMGVGTGRVAGVPVTVYRISFSGELAYEIAAPAGDTEAVWSAILAAGEQHGIVPYGVEALSVLRVEKGHVAGPELNGQTTAGDLGLGRMLKRSGDFVGRVNASRPGLVAADRPRLVGIQAVSREFGKRLRAGAHIVASESSKASLGWVTSVTRSVELDRWIGLAMVRGGPERIGSTMYATYPLKGEVMPVTITSPHHVDPENQRVRA